MIPAGRYRERIRRLEAIAKERSLAGVLVGVGPDLQYLTGYRAMPLERLTMLTVVPGREATLVVPRLERAAAESGLQADVPLVTWDETDDPHGLVIDAILGAWPEEPAAAELVVAVSDRLWTSHLLRLQGELDGREAVRSYRFLPASVVLRELRMVKDAEEVELLRQAAHAADRVVAAIAAGPLVGRSESDVSREVRERLLAEGHEEAHFAIVGSGPNSASPHHDATDRVIQAGEPIVLDIGGTVDGYGSDITRTLWVTGGEDANGPDPEFRRLFRLVREAQAAGSNAVRPGIACEQLDEVARTIIATGGYGDRFIHRLGHGIGLEGHEEPYLVAGNAEPLREGHAFSIEPGIYLDGRYGARIEDIVVCGPDGPIVLNEAPRDLYVVAG
jgi:Xaa-Pro aminopeptidase